MTTFQGTGVDQATVEQVKALRRLGKTHTQIAKMTGASVSTVGRYLRRPDVSPVQEEQRDAEMAQFVKRGWAMILNDFMPAIEKKKHLLDDVKTTREMKEVVTMMAIMFDKLGIVNANARPAGTGGVPSLTVNVNVSQPHAIADSTPVLYIDGEVQSDGGGAGSGEDVPRMLGSGTAEHPPED